MPTLLTYTLGCKVNRYETEYVRSGLARLGYVRPRPGEPVDLCVINTCTVTATADSKSRKMIRQFGRKFPEAQIVVMGCLATRQREELARLPGVVQVITDKERLGEFLLERGLAEIPTGIDTFEARHRAFVKVQDGCRVGCTYCIIPKVRPKLLSRPVEHVLDEVRRLTDAGYRELVLTGIHLGHYGVDQAANASGSRPNLTNLCERITDLPGKFRLRLSSLEAVEVDNALIDLLAACPERLCPHLHVSMQSGCDAVLERMGRRMSSSRFIDVCKNIEERLPLPALTTDVIVGFPGEMEAEFDRTLEVVEEIGFSKVHVFRFSPREGTEAATMSDQIIESVKQQRAARLIALAEKLRLEYFDRLVGRPMQVLIEHAPSECSMDLQEKASVDIASHSAFYQGTSARYAPVLIEGGQLVVGELVDCTAIRREGEQVIARI